MQVVTALNLISNRIVYPSLWHDNPEEMQYSICFGIN